MPSRFREKHYKGDDADYNTKKNTMIKNAEEV